MRRKFFGNANDAFEVATQEIVTYDVPARSLLKSMFRPDEFNYASQFPITPKTEIVVHVHDSNEKAGMCIIKTGDQRREFHLLGFVDAFAQEVNVARHELTKALSPAPEPGR